MRALSLCTASELKVLLVIHTTVGYGNELYMSGHACLWGRNGEQENGVFLKVVMLVGNLLTMCV